jgi:hypothetical protein
LTQRQQGLVIVIVTSRAKIFGLGDKGGDMRLLFRFARREPQMLPRAKPCLEGTANTCCLA